MHPWGCPWVVPFVSLPYELFLAASVVAGQYELCHLFYLSQLVSSITVQYVQSQVGCVVLLVNDLFLVVPFVRGRYELFLAMLWKVRYFLCCHLLLRSMSFFGRVLRCTFTVQEQLQVGVGYWAMGCELVMSVATVLYKRMSMGLGS